MDTICRRALLGLGLLACIVLAAVPMLLVGLPFALRKRFAPLEPSILCTLMGRHPFLFDLLMLCGHFPVMEDKFRKVPPLKGSVLHVACGTGYGASLLSAASSEFVNLDINPRSLEWARRRGRVEHCVVGDAYAMPFPGGRFDAVVSAYAFHHFRDPAGLFREVRRVLKDGGSLVIMDLACRGRRPLELWNHLTDGPIWTYDTTSIGEVLRGLSEAHGFALRSLRFSRPDTLMGRNPFYPCSEYVAELAAVPRG